MTKNKQEPQQIDISVDCVVFGFDDKKLKVLLIEQKQPEKGKPLKHLQFALPGDLVQHDESFDKAATRVLKELTSLEGIYLKQFHAFGDPNRVKDLKDQEWLRTFRAHPERRVITVGYYSMVNIYDSKSTGKSKSGDDSLANKVNLNETRPEPNSFAGNTTWVDVYQIPELAFDHNNIVNHALEAFRHDLAADKIGFELLPEKFTLSQLQRLHEIVLDKKLDKRNFRKNILKIEHLKPLDEKQKGVLHKPAQLYQFKKKKSK